VDKEIREIVRKLIRQGWRVEWAPKRQHGMAYSPDGVTIVVLPSTPGGGRWKQNLLTALRRGGYRD
jgi:hypothetical protein